MRIFIIFNRSNIFAIITFLSSLFLFGSPALAQPIKIVVTIFPLADMARQIGGGEAEVHLLLKPGRSPHTFEPSPKDLVNLTTADMVIRAGFGLEPWLDELLKAQGNKNRAIVDLSTYIKAPIHYSDGGAHHHGEDHGHSDAGVNPHFWLDPVLMVDVAKGLQDRLAKIKPSAKNTFSGNTETAVNKLIRLDHEIRQILITKPGSVREVIAFHNSWAYFAARYNLTIAGIIERSPGREPSARWFAKLISIIRKRKINGVLVEPQMSQKLGKVLGSETGSVVVTVDPIGGQKGREGYYELMMWNAKQFRKAIVGAGSRGN